MEDVLLNRVCILGIFCPKQSQGFKPSTAHLYPNIGRVPPTPHPADVGENRQRDQLNECLCVRSWDQTQQHKQSRIGHTDCVHKNSVRYTQSAVRGPQSMRYTSLLTDALFSLQSQSSAGDKIQTAGDLLTASARGQWWRKKKVEENHQLLTHAHSRALASLADVFEKNEKKNKTTSVYRLALYQTGLQCTVVKNYCIFKDQT